MIEEIGLQVTSRRHLEEGLDAAVEKLRKTAMLTGTHGILLTRHKPDHYTAKLSETVPFGITRELIL